MVKIKSCMQELKELEGMITFAQKLIFENPNSFAYKLNLHSLTQRQNKVVEELIKYKEESPY